MNIIITVDKNWAYGYKGKALVSIPEDMQLFMQETMGKVVVMDRDFLDNYFGGKIIKNRTNIVICADKSYNLTDALIVNNIEEAKETLKAYNDKDIYIMGGEHVFKAFFDCCDVVHVTKIDYTYQADQYFIDLDKESWKVNNRSDERTYFNLEYEFIEYVRG